jgi:hypothetical protein
MNKVQEQLLKTIFTEYLEDFNEWVVEGAYYVLIVNSFTGSETEVRAIRNDLLWDRLGFSHEIPDDIDEVVVLVEDCGWRVK